MKVSSVSETVILSYRMDTLSLANILHSIINHVSITASVENIVINNIEDMRPSEDLYDIDINKLLTGGNNEYQDLYKILYELTYSLDMNIGYEISTHNTFTKRDFSIYTSAKNIESSLNIDLENGTITNAFGIKNNDDINNQYDLFINNINSSMVIVTSSTLPGDKFCGGSIEVSNRMDIVYDREDMYNTINNVASDIMHIIGVENHTVEGNTIIIPTESYTRIPPELVKDYNRRKLYELIDSKTPELPNIDISIDTGDGRIIGGDDYVVSYKIGSRTISMSYETNEDKYRIASKLLKGSEIYRNCNSNHIYH